MKTAEQIKEQIIETYKIELVDKLPKVGDPGTIYCLRDGSMYVFTDWGCTELGITKETEEDASGEIPYTNCPNCGAPVSKYADACPYCETPYIKNGGIYARQW